MRVALYPDGRKATVHRRQDAGSDIAGKRRRWRRPSEIAGNRRL